MKEYIDKVSMEETSEGYGLTVSLKKDQINNFLQNTLKEQVKELNQLTSGDDITFKDVKMHYIIDKETYYPKSENMTIDMVMRQDDQTLKANASIDVAFSNFNKIDKIVIPDKVKKEAKSHE